MSCPDEVVLWALVQGTVDAESMSTLDAHLDECAECREVVGAVASGVRRQSGSADGLKTLGRFEVGEPLGEGAMGVVFAGVDPELERPVALKVLHDAADSAKGRARLVREAQAMARLAHAHVLTVYEVGTDGDRVFIAMERGEGNLRDAIRDGGDGATIAAAMVQAGQGLAAAHRAGILHRDFKPENVMLMADGSAKVADFGLAGVSLGSATDGPIDLTRTGALLGTPVYMAPERLGGAPGDARADQFSFCVAMWEALEGERPFGGRNIEALLSAIADGPPTKVRMADAYLRVLRRGLAADPEARFESMDALLASLPATEDSAAPKSRRLFAVVAVAAAIAGVLAVASGTRAPVVADPQPGGTVCDELILPEQPALEGWREARLDAWRVQWERSRAEVCERTHAPRAVACLSAQAAEVARFDMEAPPEAFVHVPDPAACEAGAAPLERELSEVRALLRLGDADGVGRLLAEGTREGAEAALLGARGARLRAEFGTAEELARDALFRAQQDDDHYNEAQAWLELVAVAGAAGEYDRAARELAHAGQAVDEADVDSLRERLRHSQGVVRTQLGDFEGARRALDEAVRLRAQRLGEDTVEVAALHTSLGHLARLEERLDDAFEHHSAAKRLNSMLDPEHLWVARDLHNLAGILRREHRFDEALDSYRRSIAIRRERLGPEHPEVALGLNSVGLVLFETEDFEGARETWQQALSIFNDNDHADAAMSDHNLALANLALDEPAVALAHALSALRRDEARLGPDAKRVGAELVTVAKALVRLGRLDEAQTRVARAKEIAVLLDDPALAAEAEDVVAGSRPRRRPRARSEGATMAALTVEAPEPTPEPTTMDTEPAESEENTAATSPSMTATTVTMTTPPRMASPTMTSMNYRNAGSGSYGGGQAWE